MLATSKGTRERNPSAPSYTYGGTQVSILLLARTRVRRSCSHEIDDDVSAAAATDLRHRALFECAIRDRRSRESYALYFAPAARPASRECRLAADRDYRHPICSQCARPLRPARMPAALSRRHARATPRLGCADIGARCPASQVVGETVGPSNGFDAVGFGNRFEISERDPRFICPRAQFAVTRVA